MRTSRKYSGPPVRRRGPWYKDVIERLEFERGVKEQFPLLRGVDIKGGYEYRITLPVPDYDSRKVRIKFVGYSKVPAVVADGPNESPHRYGDKKLCMWHPEDPEDRRWVFADDLLSLIVLTMIHLFREAWWRDTGEWVGEEFPHDPKGKDAAQS